MARFGGEGASRPGVRTRTAVNSIPVLRSARGKLLNEAIARLWASKPFPRRSWGDRSLIAVRAWRDAGITDERRIGAPNRLGRIRRAIIGVMGGAPARFPAPGRAGIGVRSGIPAVERPMTAGHQVLSPPCGAGEENYKSDETRSFHGSLSKGARRAR